MLRIDVDGVSKQEASSSLSSTQIEGSEHSAVRQHADPPP